MLRTVAILAAISGSLTSGVFGATVCSRDPHSMDSGVVPLPKSFARVPFSTTCVQAEQGFTYDNGNFSDGNGPRGAMNASDCCAQVSILQYTFCMCNTGIHPYTKLMRYIDDTPFSAPRSPTVNSGASISTPLCLPPPVYVDGQRSTTAAYFTPATPTL